MEEAAPAEGVAAEGVGVEGVAAEGVAGAQAAAAAVWANADMGGKPRSIRSNGRSPSRVIVGQLEALAKRTVCGLRATSLIPSPEVPPQCSALLHRSPHPGLVLQPRRESGIAKVCKADRLETSSLRISLGAACGTKDDQHQG